MIELTLESTKGVPVSHNKDSEQAQGIVLFAWFVLGIALLGGLVIKAVSEYPNETDRLKDNVSVGTTVPVQSYGPGDTSGVTEIYDRLLAPQDYPDDCQVSTGNAVADLMLGINAC